MSGAVPEADAQKIPTSPPIGTDEELIERLRRTETRKSYVATNRTAPIIETDYEAPINPDGPEAADALQSRISEVERLTALASELVTLLIDEDHKRLCQGREYACSCEYDGDVQFKAGVLRAALSPHRTTDRG